MRTVLRDGDTLIAIYAIDQNTGEDGYKIVPDDRIAGELSSQAAAAQTSLEAMNMPDTLGIVSPFPIYPTYPSNPLPHPPSRLPGIF